MKSKDEAVKTQTQLDLTLNALNTSDASALKHVEWLTGNLDDAEQKRHITGVFRAIEKYGVANAIVKFKRALGKRRFEFFVYDLACYGHFVDGVKNKKDADERYAKLK
jgi:hypothetical protein